MSFKKQTLNGFIWAFIDSFFVKAMTFMTLILLARWLGPKDFGLVGMIAIFISLGLILTDSGMTSSLIRTKYSDERDYSTIFIINLVISILVYIIVYNLAPWISVFFGQPILINVIRLYCIIFILSSFSAVHLAILMKEMNFGQITKINFLSSVIGIFVGLYLGYYNFGVWSIIWMYLTTETIKSLLLWQYSWWRPKLTFSKVKLKIHYNFGYKLMLSGIIDIIFKNIYNILIGRFYSIQILGYYERAIQFSEYPSSSLTGVLTKVSYPLLSKIHNDKPRIESAYRKLLRISFFIIAPIMMGTAAIAKPLFLFLLGSEWLPAVLFFQISSLGMMLYPIHSFNLNILKVAGRSDLFLKLEIIKKIIISISILIAFQFGVLGLVWCNVFTSFSALGVNMYFSSHIINYKIKEQILDLSQTLAITIFTTFLMYIITKLFPANYLISQILLALILGVIIYFIINYFIKASPLHQAIYLIKNIKQ